MLNSICGNEELKQSLLAALGGGRLSHSVLIAGEDGAGAAFAARCLAADYLYPQGGNEAACVMRGESAECITITGEGASGDIKIDTVRQMRRDIYSTALSANGRCVIIKGGHKLNLPSANALLKVLEEPPENVLFILTAPSEAAVLATIRSRCAIYTISPVSEDICNDYLVQKGVDSTKASELTRVFKGRIGICKRVLDDENEHTWYTAAQALYNAATIKDELAAGAVLASFEKDRHNAVKMLTYARAIYSDNLLHGSAQSALAMTAIFDAILQLSRNANAKLVFTALAMQMCA